MRNRRGVLGFLAALAAATLGMASAAWACTVFANVVGVDPVQAPERGLVRVQGDGLAGKATAVELRWDGVTGPVLASAPVDAKGRFSAQVVLPAAASPGVHSLVAVAEGAGIGRAAVEVLASGRAGVVAAPADASPSTDRWTVKVEPTGSNGSGMNLALGAGLLGGGLLVLGAGSAVVAGKRRRATVTSR